MSKNPSNNLTALFSPSSIALIGAAREEKKIGHIVLKNIIDGGFSGTLFPINPQADSILNLKCYPDYSVLPVVPDLAIIAIPAAPAVEILAAIAKKGTKNILIFSAGFKEVGEAGKKLDDQLISVAREFGLNIIGPNCLGFVNNDVHLNATFGRLNAVTGNLRFISQSGAIATSIFDWAQNAGVTFSHFITLGNKTILTENEVLEYFLSLPRSSDCRPIGLYLESIEHGIEFVKIVKKITEHDPVFLLKPGKSVGAQRAMQSHTGAMAGEDAVIETALREAGVVRCNGVEDMFDFSRAFAWEVAPAGPNVAIVSNAGGPAVISTDILDEEGLKLAPITPATDLELKKYLPAASNFHDPIDVLGDALADRYASAINIILAEREVDALLVILTPQMMTQVEATAKIVVSASRKFHKPIFCSFMGGASIDVAEKILNDAKIPSFRFPERAIRALGKMWWWASFVKTTAAKNKSEQARIRPTSHLVSETSPYPPLVERGGGRFAAPLSKKEGVQGEISRFHSQNRAALSSLESNAILKLAGITTPPTTFVAKISDAKKFAEKFGWPVVLKISSAEIIHKTESGGVIVDIKNSVELKKSFNEIKKRINHLSNRRGVLPYAPNTNGAQIQIQKQIESGIEVIVGVKRDPSFGSILMFGAGGTFAELIVDRNLALFPLDDSKIFGLINQSKVAKLLNGYRGEAPYPTDKLVYLIIKLGHLVDGIPEIKEIEINPVIVTRKNVWAVDGKVLLQ